MTISQDWLTHTVILNICVIYTLSTFNMRHFTFIQIQISLGDFQFYIVTCRYFYTLPEINLVPLTFLVHVKLFSA